METSMSEMYNGIYEIVVAVNDIEASAKRIAEVFDKELDEFHTVGDAGIELTGTGVWFGETRLAIVTDSTGNGPTARLLAKRGPGVSEICMRTPDLRAAIADLKAKDVRLVSDVPNVATNYLWKDGKVYSKVEYVFIHPADMFGVQIELQQWTE
jgi:methylmalonyl-CoA/ethylmalonyl-CoA epimerase